MKPGFICLQWEKDKLWFEKDTYLYVGWTNSKNIAGLAMSPYHLSLPRIIGSNIFSMLDFFSPNFFIFSSEFFGLKLGSPIEKSSVIFLNKDKILIFPEKQNQFPSEVDEKRMCPLRHLLLLSRKLNEKQLNSFLIALKYGFPVADLIDFEKKTIKAGAVEITKEWNSKSSDQKGSLERDFVRTLRLAIKSIGDEHFRLFEKISSIIPSEDYPKYSLAPLFTLLPHVLARKSEADPTQPKIGIRSLKFEAIFEFEEEKILNFIADLREGLSSDVFNVSINEIGRIRLKNVEDLDKEYYRARISVILDAIPDSLKLEDSVAMVEELTNLAIEDALYKSSIESYEKFCKHKIPEFWLKNAGVAVEVPLFMIDKTQELIRSTFGLHLDPSQSIKIHRKAENRVAIIFYLYFSPAYDYVIGGGDKGLFPHAQARDPYTNIGIEHLMRKEFSEAFKFLRMAKKGLARDYLDINTSSKDGIEFKNKIMREINRYCSMKDISSDDLYSLPNYTNESDKDMIIGMLKTTEEWIRTATRFQLIDDLERQIRYSFSSEAELAKNAKKLNFLLKRTQFRFFKNFFNFIEDIGSFYVLLLQEAEKEAPDSVRKWIGLTV